MGLNHTQELYPIDIVLIERHRFGQNNFHKLKLSRLYLGAIQIYHTYKSLAFIIHDKVVKQIGGTHIYFCHLTCQQQASATQ